jgi:hypothetical protein
MNHKFEITKMQMKHNMEMNEMKCKLNFLEAKEKHTKCNMQTTFPRAQNIGHLEQVQPSIVHTPLYWLMPVELLYIVVLISFIVLNWWRLCIYIRSIIALMYRILVPVVCSHFILL